MTLEVIMKKLEGASSVSHSLDIRMGCNTNNASNAPANADNGGVMIIETYSASAVTVPGNYNSNSNANAAGNNSDMQPLPGDPGVEVAPVNSTAGQPVVVEEEDVLVQETEDGE